MTTIKSILRHFLRTPAHVEGADREVENELRFHIEMRTRDNIAAGMTAKEAEAEAVRRFGDFNQIRVICEEIRKERQAGVMNLIKGVIYTMIGCGLILKLTAGITGLRLVGDFLFLIAILWRLLVYLRELQPDQHRIRAAERPVLSGIYTISDFSMSDFVESRIDPIPASDKPIPTYNKDGRTPVERLIGDK